MKTMASLDDLKKKHETLYSAALDKHTDLLEDKASLDRFVGEVDSLLEHAETLSRQVTSFDDHNWLTNAALKWQIIFSSLLNIPRALAPLSTSRELTPSNETSFLDDRDIQAWLEETAYRQSVIRRIDQVLRGGVVIDHIRSTPEEMDEDWHSANTIFALRVLEGDLDLATEIRSASYPRLEAEWLADVKRTKAYFIWTRSDDRFDPAYDHKAAYYRACSEIRDRLANPDVKGSPEEFEYARAYLEEKYLDGQGRLDPRKSFDLVKVKAKRVYDNNPVPGRDQKNWAVAETYARGFYESLIPAVTEGRPDSTLAVLKAFQFSKENRYLIINCFEVALAVCFLDAETVQDIWEQGLLARDSTL